MHSGRIEEVIYTRLNPGEDILEALYDICVQKDIKTGIILEGSGCALNFTYQHFPKNPNMCPTNVEIAALEGKCEVSLQGTIGTTVYDVSEDSPKQISKLFPFVKGVIENDSDKWHMIGSKCGDGSPYIHAHCTATNKDSTVCGHLMPGTKVGSGNAETGKPAHFTVIIAKVSGVELQAVINDELGFHQNIRSV